MASRSNRVGGERQDGRDVLESLIPASAGRRTGESGRTPALVDGRSGRTHTYRKLIDDVELVAARLTERGFGTDGKLVVHSPGLSEYVVASLAVVALGGTAILANPIATAEELADQLEDANATYLITVPPYFETAMAAASGTPVEEVFVFGDAVSETEHESGVFVTPLC